MPRNVAVVIILLFPVVAPSAEPPSEVVENKFSFPYPVQWKSGGEAQVSLIAVAWGPASSPELVSKSGEELPSGETKVFPDRPYTLAVEIRAELPGPLQAGLATSSGLVRVGSVGGDFEQPFLRLTPAGFIRYANQQGATYDIIFKHTNSIEFWDFFPSSPHQSEFLFQAFPWGHGGNPAASFRVLVNAHELKVVNASPAVRIPCSNFTMSFAGTIGADTQVRLELTAEGTTLSGTEQYVRVGKTLWLSGAADSFGNSLLEERYPKDHVTGKIKGSFSPGCRSMSGYFSKPDGSRLQPFEFHETASKP
ncbi:MAG: hypothetical protein DMG21_06015 [Acidobacteria bacterium]|nr:MAG: hypothetical protein DMG21_06015 [Acidobacteriota bacterium]